jgi:hypothetical protein
MLGRKGMNGARGFAPSVYWKIVSLFDIIYIMNAKNRKILKAIFTDPVKSNIVWSDIESLLLSLNAERKEGSGSRVAFTLNGVVLVIHRPHPRKKLIKGLLSRFGDFCRTQE